MASKRGNAHEAEQGATTFVPDSAPKDTPSVSLQTERSAAWKAADEARARSNAAAQQAAAAAAEAADLELQAIADDNDHDHVAVDPADGTWEGSVGGGSSEEASDSE